MSGLLFILDTDGIIASLNDAALAVLKYRREELEGKTIGTIIDCPASVKSGLLKTILCAPRDELGIHLIPKHGGSLPYAVSASFLPSIGIAFVARAISGVRQNIQTQRDTDNRLEAQVLELGKKLKSTKERLRGEIDERKKTAEDLEESEELFRLFFEYAPNGFYLSDLQGNLIDGNLEAERITGFKRQELVGKNMLTLNLLPASQLPKASMLAARNAAGKATGPDEFIVNRKDGARIIVEISTYPVQFRNRKLMLGIARDISQKKKHEEEKTLLERELDQAQKMEAIGRLAGGIAHDFNNLLGGIIGYAELLRLKLAAAMPAESVTAGKIFDIARQASDLTSQLLAFARKGKYQVTVIDVHTIIKNLIDLLQRTIDKRIMVLAKLKAMPPTIVGDKTQVQNALLNLAVNARDAMPRGGSLILETETIEVDEVAARTYPYKVTPGAYVKISVIDTGTGMDETTKARAFEPFFTTKESGKGTGLGLASVYGMVKNHNGFIELRSEPGKGTTVVLCLPSTDAPSAEDGPVAADRVEKRFGRVLVIDDEKIIREMTSDMLHELGYTVTTCADGGKAEIYYKEHHKEIDLAIIDFTMPGLNGTDCFHALKAINPGLRAIIASGHAIDGEISSLLEEGALKFLHKPFDLNTLADVVGKMLGS